jgi:hypothetical protein
MPFPQASSRNLKVDLYKPHLIQQLGRVSPNVLIQCKIVPLENNDTMLRLDNDVIVSRIL